MSSSWPLAKIVADADTGRSVMNERLSDSLNQQQARIADLENFIRDIRDNWDCDEDAHQHGTRCRCCEAERLMAMPEVKAND
jgi:hypothetical protein